MIDTPERIANFLALMDYSPERIAFVLVDAAGVTPDEALRVAEAAAARHESHRKHRNEATRARYADALAAEFKD